MIVRSFIFTCRVCLSYVNPYQTLLREPHENIYSRSLTHSSFFFQGDELPDVFRLFRDVHVNFTIFSMMPYDTADKTIRNYDNGFNLTLAKDSMSLLEKVTKTINLNRSVEDVRRSLQTAMKRVRQFFT